MRHIVVTKLGNEPDVFGNSLRCGMIGDWETFKLLKVLASDKQNEITYYGKAKWDVQKAYRYFDSHVTFIESSQTDDHRVISKLVSIDEFHVILGPHAFYNGGCNISSWESIKKSIVTERLLERVAPQLKLMNAFPKAKIFFYLSDRRFLFQAGDLDRYKVNVFAQSLEPQWYDRCRIVNKDYTLIDQLTEQIHPFRFETLWLYGKDYKDYKTSMSKQLNSGYINLIIPANQVTSDNEIQNSRLQKILDFTEYIDDYVVVGKWTNKDAIDKLTKNSAKVQFLDGMDMDKYNMCLLSSKYALVTYNTNDSPDVFVDNWLTVKYWECVYAGCLTFVEATEDYNSFIPDELQVRNSEELRDKLRRCEEDDKYKLSLMQLQDSLVKPEYFSGKYFNDFINGVRQND